MRTPHRPGTTTVAGPRESGANVVPSRRRRVSWPSVTGLDAVLWLGFDEVDGELVACQAHGTRHRRPVDVRITVAAGLALAEAGVPSLVCADPARAEAG